MRKVAPEERGTFREMVEAYWAELMPKADVIATAAAREAYFRQQFTWEGGDRHPYWAIADKGPVGFLSFSIDPSERRAKVHDSYVVPDMRRQGVGSTMVRWLFAHLDCLGIERVDLDVRRDSPRALAFWRAQGFGIAGYRMRMYRDPERGTAYAGALSSDLE
jgi:ribosomal protein S18 acetylase RimI-like enzyme